MKGEEYEEVEYEPTSVKNLLVEMKDTSELIVDLAYAAIMFDSDELRTEVKHLESRMDFLRYQIRMIALMASRTREDSERLAGILQVASAAETISNAAGDMADLLEQRIEARPFLPFVLREAEERIRPVYLAKGSSMVGRGIEELKVESETGMRVIAIRRGPRWTYDPPGGTVLKGEDLLIVRGTEDGYHRLTRYATGEEGWPG
ncbi:MAG: potassium transporter TrkA [Candidatus Thermoplasmatota archaeon]|nr:potassium transporter TrkA [Candidatus Thermoplasmatota archaeon]